MNDIEREVIEIKHRQDLRDQDEQHSREENENQHAQMSGRIDQLSITIDGHEVRITTLENKGTKAKAQAVDSLIKWALGILGTFIGGGILFYLGTIFGGGK
jgi:hypothetical protein